MASFHVLQLTTGHSNCGRRQRDLGRSPTRGERSSPSAGMSIPTVLFTFSSTDSKVMTMLRGACCEPSKAVRAGQVLRGAIHHCRAGRNVSAVLIS